MPAVCCDLSAFGLDRWLCTLLQYGRSVPQYSNSINDRTLKPMNSPSKPPVFAEMKRMWMKYKCGFDGDEKYTENRWNRSAPLWRWHETQFPCRKSARLRHFPCRKTKILIHNSIQADGVVDKFTGIDHVELYSRQLPSGRCLREWAGPWIYHQKNSIRSSRASICIRMWNFRRVQWPAWFDESTDIRLGRKFSYLDWVVADNKWRSRISAQWHVPGTPFRNFFANMFYKSSGDRWDESTMQLEVEAGDMRLRRMTLYRIDFSLKLQDVLNLITTIILRHDNLRNFLTPLGRRKKYLTWKTSSSLRWQKCIGAVWDRFFEWIATQWQCEAWRPFVSRSRAERIHHSQRFEAFPSDCAWEFWSRRHRSMSNSSPGWPHSAPHTSPNDCPHPMRVAGSSFPSTLRAEIPSLVSSRPVSSSSFACPYRNLAMHCRRPKPVNAIRPRWQVIESVVFNLLVSLIEKCRMHIVEYATESFVR